MTVQTTTNVVVLQGNGSADEFDFPFKVLDEDHLVVQRRVRATGVVDHTYTGGEITVAGIGDDAGSVTINAGALNAAYDLIISRIVPYTQDLDIVNQGGFYPDTVEEQLDMLAMQIQQLKDQVARSVKAAPGNSGLDIPAVGTVNTVIGFDENGDFGFFAGLPGPAGTAENNSGVVTTVIQGTPGHNITMPTTGNGSARGIKIDGGTGVGSGIMVQLRKHRAGGEPFFVLEEYSATGFLYVEREDGTPGTTAYTHTWSTWFDSAANLNSRKALIISGSARQVGTSDDPDDPGFLVELVPASLQPTMVTVFADVPVAICSRLTDTDPDDSTQVHYSFIGYGGREVRSIEKEGDDCWMDGWVPDAAGHAERTDHIEFRTGKIGRKGWGVKAGGNLHINFADEAAVTSGLVDAFDNYWDNGDGTGATGHLLITDGANPGLYWSDGTRFTDGTNFVGDDPFGWTAVYAENAGSPATVTESGSGRDAKTFTMTASNNSWDNAMQANTTITGDQLIEYEITSIAAGRELMVGLGTAVAASPILDNAYGPTKTNITGVYQSGPTLFAMAAGTSTFVALDLPRPLAVGQRLTMRKETNVMTLYQDGEPIAVIAAGMAAVAYRATVLLRTLNSEAKSVRWLELT